MPVLSEFRRVEVGFAGAAALLCALLYLLYRSPPKEPRPRTCWSPARREEIEARLAAADEAQLGGVRGRRDALKRLAGVGGAEHGRAGNEQGGARLGDAADGVRRRSRRPPRSRASGRARAIRATLSGEDSMNDCPPQPGLTDMQRTRSARSAELADRDRRRPRVERDPGQAARLADRSQRAVHVRRRPRSGR